MFGDTEIGSPPRPTTETFFEFVISRRILGFRRQTRFKGKWRVTVNRWGTIDKASGVEYGPSVAVVKQALEHERDEAFRLMGVRIVPNA
jgi:hypothetical protein